MNLALNIRPQARRDIGEIAADLDDYATGGGDRFLADLHTAFERLTTFPGLGPPWRATDPAHANTRRLVLRRFPVSIFYRASKTAVTIVRVLHHARDLPRLLKGL